MIPAAGVSAVITIKGGVHNANISYTVLWPAIKNSVLNKTGLSYSIVAADDTTLVVKTNI